MTQYDDDDASILYAIPRGAVAETVRQVATDAGLTVSDWIDLAIADAMGLALLDPNADEVTQPVRHQYADIHIRTSHTEPRRLTT